MNRHSSRGVVALLAASLLVLAGCTGSDSPGDGGESTKESETAQPSQTPAAPAITIGDNPYVPPCRLLPPEDAQEALPLTVSADFTQHEIRSSVGVDELDELRGSVRGPQVHTSCVWSLGDKLNTTLTLTVNQYVDEKSAFREWDVYRKTGNGFYIRKARKTGIPVPQIILDGPKSTGGVRLKGLDDRILWRVGIPEYAATAGNVVLHVTMGEQYGLTKTISPSTKKLAETILVGALDHLADPELARTPLPAHGDEFGGEWPAFLDPCALLDDAAFGAMYADPKPITEAAIYSTNLAEESTATSSTPAGRSQDNSCEVETADGLKSADLNIQYVAPGDDPSDVIDSYLGQYAFEDPDPSKAQLKQLHQFLVDAAISGADDSTYLQVSRAGEPDFIGLMTIDRYVLALEAEEFPTKKAVHAPSVSADYLRLGMQAVTDNALKALEAADAG